MAIGTDLIEIDIHKIKLFYDSFWCQIIILTNERFNKYLRLPLGPERLDMIDTGFAMPMA